MTKRKTMAEIRAQERLDGFVRCMEIIQRECRDQGTSTDEVLQPIIEKMQAMCGLLDDDYKVLMIPRVYGNDYTRLRVRVKVLEPHPHAGRRGFIIDGNAFMVNGMHRVYFLDHKHRADNAFAPPEQIRRTE